MVVAEAASIHWPLRQVISSPRDPASHGFVTFFRQAAYAGNQLGDLRVQRVGEGTKHCGTRLVSANAPWRTATIATAFTAKRMIGLVRCPGRRVSEYCQKVGSRGTLLTMIET
jgi:hypothetical protein